MEKSEEKVLVFDEKFMSGFKGFEEGSWSVDRAWFDHVLKHVFFAKRGDVESDPSFKQIIPYILFEANGKYLSYEREGHESRLTGKRSVGIGGHINLCDLNSTLDPDHIEDQNLPMDILSMGALREMDEEIELPIMSLGEAELYVLSHLEKPLGFIYVDGDEVDKVHFGAVYEVRVSSATASGIKLLDEGKNMSWRDADSLLAEDTLEKWSRVALENVK